MEQATIVKMSEHTMFPTNYRSKYFSLLAIILILTSGLLGCGLRSANTGSLSSRIVNSKGDAVVGAKVFSIFDASRQVYTDSSGKFYLAELPAGINNIVITHPDYALESRQVTIKSDDTTVIDSIKLDKANAPNQISEVKVKSVSSSTATITWNTYKNVISNIDYGQTLQYGMLYREQISKTTHEATITNLSPETLYHFRIQYIDENAKSHYSYDYSFKTTQPERPTPPVSIQIASFSQLEVVRIEWQKSTSPSVVGYNVFRRKEGKLWEKITDTPVSSKVQYYEDLNADSGTFWQYAVTSINDRGANSKKTISKVIFTPGIMNHDTEITINQSPVILTSDLVIAPGANLTVDAGVKFEISEKDSMQSGLDDQRVEILVQGRLAIMGTESSPVIFTPLDGSGKRDHWCGIKVLSDKTGISELHNVNMFGCKGYAIDVEANTFIADSVHIKYCENGIKLSGVNNYFKFNNSSIQEIASEAIFIHNCKRISLNNTQISQTKTGIRVLNSSPDNSIEAYYTYINASKSGIIGTFGKSKFINDLIISKSGIGIIANDFLNSKSNYIDHCTIDALQGIRIVKGNVKIENNIISNTALSGNIGIENSSIMVPSYPYNDVNGFTSAYIGCGTTVGGTTIRPDFKGGNPFDYHLRATSPLKVQDRYGEELGRYGISKL